MADGATTVRAGAERPWWQFGVIYQVYPRSLQDTDADGVGDLRGIRERVPYFKALGVTAIWLSPVYTSPMADFGYDVADYTGIDPLFGTMADFDDLLAATHKAGLKLVMDFVPNHSSDRHAWFEASRSSRTDPHRDWYIWHDPVPYPWMQPGEDKRPPSEQRPNNWMSHFGGPAWTWDDATQQFYLHSFLAAQPDLNWRNPALKAAIFAAMRFWLDKGVDGFRMDVLWLLIKDAEFRNNPPNPDWCGPENEFAAWLPRYTSDRPETHAIVREMRALLDGYARGMSRRVLIGEIYLPLPQLVAYYGDVAATPPVLDGADMPFNFRLIQTPWNAEAIAAVVRDYESLLPAGAWPNYVLGNHDQSRLATRIGAAQARVAQMLLLTLRGTPTMYYGDELAMTDVAIAPDEVRDPATAHGGGRDPERSPMLWSAAANAGFTATGAKPWLPLLADWPTRNVAVQGTEAKSQLSLVRALLHVRRHLPALSVGDIADMRATDGVLSFTRAATLIDGAGTDVPQRLEVHLNLTGEERTVPCGTGTLLFTTMMDGAGAAVEGTLTLEANEGALIALEDARRDDVTARQQAG